MGKLRYTNGFLYKTTTLEDEKQDLILAFLNKQANPTQSMHRILLHHIEKCGIGDVLDYDVQKLMYASSNEETRNMNVSAFVQPQNENSNAVPTRNSEPQEKSVPQPIPQNDALGQTTDSEGKSDGIVIGLTEDSFDGNGF